MLDKTSNISNPNLSVLKKTSATKSCESLLCLTNRCNQEQNKNKQKTLNFQYFEKLSLKKFTQSSFMNNSYLDKQKQYQKTGFLKDKRKQQNKFENIVLNQNYRQGAKYSIGANNSNNMNLSTQMDGQRRIARSSSHKQLQKTQLNTTDRSIENQLSKDMRRIEDLQQLRSRLQKQISQLDQNIDKYYTVYHKKLEDLKNIQTKMSELDNNRSLQKVPSSDELKMFKKKCYVQSPSVYRINQNQRIQQKSKFNGSIPNQNALYTGQQGHYHSGNTFYHINKHN